MEFEVLGSLEVTANGASAAPSAPKPRQVLALLLLNSNKVTPVTDLKEELWGDSPPRTATTALQTYIMQVRKALSAALGKSAGGAARDLLQTRGDGYLLRVQPGQLDVDRYQRLLADGRRALLERRETAAAQLLRAALALWRDSPLAGLRAGRLLQIHIVGLTESRRSAVLQRVETDLRLGLHQEVVSELTELAAQDRLHEDVHAKLMLTLYRCGRRYDALATFRQLRAALAEELGVAPSQRLERLHRALLTCSPELDGLSYAAA
jgi:DNA-binding SARP family transcriptional activator